MQRRCPAPRARVRVGSGAAERAARRGGADPGTIGGYPKIGGATASDLARPARPRRRSTARFAVVSPDEAREITLSEPAAVRGWPRFLRDLARPSQTGAGHPRHQHAREEAAPARLGTRPGADRGGVATVRAADRQVTDPGTTDATPRSAARPPPTSRGWPVLPGSTARFAVVSPEDAREITLSEPAAVRGRPFFRDFGSLRLPTPAVSCPDPVRNAGAQPPPSGPACRGPDRERRLRAGYPS